LNIVVLETLVIIILNNSSDHLLVGMVLLLNTNSFMEFTIMFNNMVITGDMHGKFCALLCLLKMAFM